MSEDNLERFIIAQSKNYGAALAEIIKGRKQSHWMWYVFPQVQGLGISETSRLYAIKDINEATAFLAHPLLGSRLLNICRELLKQAGNNATGIFGKPDDMKLKSSMTLFSLVKDTDPVFQQLLDKFFDGTKDGKTLQIINGK